MLVVKILFGKWIIREVVVWFVEVDFFVNFVIWFVFIFKVFELVFNSIKCSDFGICIIFCLIFVVFSKVRIFLRIVVVDDDVFFWVWFFIYIVEDRI